LVRPQPLPDIAVEIRSPSTWRYDIGVKKARYEEHGLPELWLVDTAADEVIVFRRSQPKAPTFDVSLELARGDALTSPLLPGFALALDELFGPPAA
jgi:Uma2 family endonuclease